MSILTAKETTNATQLKRQAAVISGLSLILMAIAAGIAYGFVYTQLIAPDDMQTTWNTLKEKQHLFTLGIFGWLIVFITDLLVTWGFYVYFKSSNPTGSLLAALLRLAYTLFLGIAISNLLSVQSLITNSALFEKSSESLATLSIFLSTFEATWSLGLIVFGFHLMLIGVLTLSSGHVPKIISILLLIAGVSYVLIHALTNFAPDQMKLIQSLTAILAIPMTIGELGFGIWLLIRPKAPQ